MDTLNIAIITAAGGGTRLSGTTKKQFRELGGIPILIRTLGRFFASALIDSIIVTAPEADVGYCEDLIRRFFEDSTKPWLVIAGGMERQDSIFGALQRCPADTGYVFIHDGVRPFVNEDLLTALYEIALKESAAIPVARLKNTIKTIEQEYVGQTLVRDNLVQVFTPQVFSCSLIKAAYAKAYQDGFVSTDDASLVEYYGARVAYHFSTDLNLKITDELDLFFAGQIIENNLI